MSTALNNNQDLLETLESLNDKVNGIKDFMEIQDRKLVVTGDKAQTELAYKAYAAAATEIYEMQTVEDGLKRDGKDSNLDALESIALEQAFANMQTVKRKFAEPYRELRRNNGVVANMSEPLTEKQQSDFEVVIKAIDTLNANPFRQQVVRELILDFGAIVQGTGKNKKRIGQEISHMHPAKTELWYRYNSKIVEVLDSQIQSHQQEIDSQDNASEDEIKKLEALTVLREQKFQNMENKESELLKHGIIASDLN